MPAQKVAVQSAAVGQLSAIADRWARARPISMSTHPARYLAEPCPRCMCRGGVYRPADLRSFCSRWRASSHLRTGACPRSSPPVNWRPGGADTGERLDPDHIGVPWVGGKNLARRVLARHPRLMDADALHGRSTPRPVSLGMGQQEALPRLLDRFFEDAMSRHRLWASPQGARPGGIFRARPRHQSAGAYFPVGGWRAGAKPVLGGGFVGLSWAAWARSVPMRGA